MKEFFVVAERTIQFCEYSEPPLGPHEVRVKAIVSGIKHGTEMALYRGKTPFLTEAFDPTYRLFMPKEGHSLYPCRLGSWLAGEVIEVGAEVSRFRVGDKVHGGMPHRPTNVVDENKLYLLPPGMKPETALFTDPSIFALAAVHDAQLKIGDRVAIFGMGALGLIAVQLARMAGAELVIAVDAIDKRLALARQFGADVTLNARTDDVPLTIKDLTDKKGVDCAIEISGAVPEWHHNRPTLISSMPVWGMPHRHYPLWDRTRIEQTCVRLLESGRIVTEPMIGRRFRYDQAPEAYRMIDEHPEESIKTLFDYVD